MSDDAAAAMKLSNPTSGPQMLIGESTFSASNMKASAAQQQRMLEMMDEKQILQWEIEQEKDKLRAKERQQASQNEQTR